MSYAVDPQPLSIIAGKDFVHSWEVAQATTGPADDLTGIGAVEFRMGKVGLPEAPTVVWSILSGHFEIVGAEMVLTVAGEETEDLPPGNWTWLLSYGASDPETPLAAGRAGVTAEP